MNNRPTYKELEPLLAERRHDKEQQMVQCVFVCPTTLRRVEASAYVRQGTGLKDRLVDAVARSFWWELRGTVVRTIASFMPAGFIRNVVEGSAWQMSYAAPDDIVTDSELDQATVEAFLSVRHEFEKDGADWKSREVANDFVTDFQQQLAQHPITTRYEGEILTRVLSTIATVDGQEPEERAFMEEFAPFLLAHNAAEPSPVELSELDQSVKPSVYLLASTLARVDLHRSPQEISYLRQLAQNLDLSKDEVKRLDGAAGQFVVEQSLHSSDRPSNEEIAQLAKATGLTTDEVERVLVRQRKRA